jgi:Protein of unknown function (DUF4435)
MTADEIIASIRTSTLPTVFVEGKDDMSVYRQIEKLFGTRKVNFFPCGGRTTLLEIFHRRNELSNITSLFIADKDMWVLTSVPSEFSDIHFTHGYSLENDLYIDGQHIIDGLLDEEELIIKRETLNSLIEWFSYEADLYLSGQVADNKFAAITILNDKIMPIGANSFSTSFLSDRNFQTPNTNTYQDIATNYKVKLRGKFIFQTYLRIFVHFRKKKDTHAVVFSDAQLFELCYREGIKPQNSNSNMNRVLSAIKHKLLTK